MSEQTQDVPQTQAIKVADKGPKVPILIGAGGVKLDSFEAAWRLAACMVCTPFCPKGMDNVESLTIGMMYCMSVGLDPITGIQNVAVINGRPSLWGDSMLGLILARPECEDVVETFVGETAKCVVTRKGRAPVEREFSYADAKQAGLMGKQGPWSQYPKRMAQMRARSWALRDAFADVLRGIAMVEEAEDSPEVETKRQPRISAYSGSKADQMKEAAEAAKATKHPEPQNGGEKVAAPTSDQPAQVAHPPAAYAATAKDEAGVQTAAKSTAGQQTSGRPKQAKAEESQDPAAAAATFAAEIPSISKGRDWLLTQPKFREPAMKHLNTLSNLGDITDLGEMRQIVETTRFLQLGGKLQ